MTLFTGFTEYCHTKHRDTQITSNMMLLSYLLLVCVLGTFTCHGYERNNEFNQVSAFGGPVAEDVEDVGYEVMEKPDQEEEVTGTSCSCNSRTGCACCYKNKWKYAVFVKIKLEACMRMSLLPGGGAYLIFSLNKRNVFFRKVSLRFLPRPCDKVPKLPGFLTKSRVCLAFYRVNLVTNTVCAHITGYIKVTGHTYNVYANFGCIRLPKRTEIGQAMDSNTLQNDEQIDMMTDDIFDIDEI